MGTQQSEREWKYPKLSHGTHDITVYTYYHCQENLAKNNKSLQHLIYYYEFGLKCSELSSKGMGQLWSYNTILK